MKRRKLKVARKLRKLLAESEFSKFTMLELRDEFEARYGLGNCSSSSELRKWIYRRILPLVNRGYLTKNSDSDNQTSVYQVSEQFRKEFRLRRRFIEPKAPTKLTLESSAPAQLSVLKAKLNQYQVDMLSCAGECKEYQQLAADYPHLIDQIEPMFRSARERSSKLKGQLKAINNLLEISGLPE